ncbi:MAG: fatty acid desaturase [Pseudomonadota bacterium]
MTARINDEAYFQRLKIKPLIAWPTVLMMLGCHAAIALSWYGVLTGGLPMWAGCLVCCFAFYGIFSPSHDGMHRSLSRVGWLNELLLFVTVLPAVPLSTGHALRVMHMQHHKYLNQGPMDPDHDIAKDWKNAFWMWFWWDIRYSHYFQLYQTDIPRNNHARIWYDLTVPFFVLIVLAFFFPWEMLFLWFIPTRFMAWMICFTFMYLPHWPHETTEKQDRYKATTVRRGWEWLLTPLLVYQNYHLMHHLYPTIPFYRYRKAWLARLDTHLQHRPAMVSAFGLRHLPDDTGDAGAMVEKKPG